MAYRTDLPRIRTTEAPSLFNREAGIGAFVGSSVTSLAVGAIALAALGNVPMVMTAMIVGDLVGFVVGGIYGGNKGKARQQAELRDGRPVKEPSYWNSGIVNGLLLGGLVIEAVSLAVPVTQGLILAASLVGVTIGSFVRKGNMERDVETAIRQQGQERAVERVRAPQQGVGLGQGRGVYKNSVTEQDAALLEERLVAKPASQIDALAQRAAEQDKQQPQLG